MIKVNGQEFSNLKEAQDYAEKIKADPNYVAPVKEEVTEVAIVKDPIDPAASLKTFGEVASGMDLAAEGSDQTVTTQVEQPTEAQAAFDAAPTDVVFPSTNSEATQETVVSDTAEANDVVSSESAENDTQDHGHHDALADQGLV